MKNQFPCPERISITNKHRFKKLPLPKTKKLSKTILDILGRTDAGLEVLFISDRAMMRWNRQVFGKNYPTDVISFPLEESKFLGSVLISLDRAGVQARQLGHSLMEEVKILLIHGILHLLGYDDTNPRKARIMKRMEKKVLSSLRKQGSRG